MEQQFTTLDEIYEKFNIQKNNTNKIYEKDILNIFNGNIEISTLSDNTNLLRYQSFYFGHIKKDYEQMKIYLNILINKINCQNAMFGLAHYYQHIEKDYEQMKKYYNLINSNILKIFSYNNLGCYYDNIENNQNLAKKYFLMAIKLGNEIALKNLNNITEELELYHLLNSISSKNDIIKNRLKELEQIDEIKNFIEITNN